jgi:hypothetical protein
MNKTHILKIVVPVDKGVNRISIPRNKQQTLAFGRKGKTAGYASCHEMINDKLTIYYGLVAGEDKGIGKNAPEAKRLVV